MNSAITELSLRGQAILESILDMKSGICHMEKIWSKQFPVSKSGIGYSDSNIQRDGVHYTFDQNGFRLYPNYQPRSSKKVFCFGCENTFGRSMSDEDTWPLLLAKELGGWNVKNFGCEGDSVESIARTCYQVIEAIETEEYPDAVFILLPDFFREEYNGNMEDRIIQMNINLLDHQIPLEALKSKLGVNTENMHDIDYAKITSYYDYTSSVFGFYSIAEPCKLIEQTLLEKNIKWFWYSYFPLYYKVEKKIISNYIGSNTLLGEEHMTNIFGKETITVLSKEEHKLLSQNFSNLYENSIQKTV